MGWKSAHLCSCKYVTVCGNIRDRKQTDVDPKAPAHDGDKVQKWDI